MNFNLEYLKTITVLYVEDEDDVRTQVSTTFNKLFKKVYLASDGEEGLNIFKEHKDEIEIIISDINMPHKSGLEMVSDILEIQKVPIILTTAHTGEEYLMKAIDLDIDKYIAKPIKIKELTLSISELVEKHRKEVQIKKATASLIVKSKAMNEEKKQLSVQTESMIQELELLRDLSDNFINIIRTDKKGIITEVSTKFCQQFGYKKDEIIGKSISSIEDGNKIQKYMLDVMYEKKVMTKIHTFNSKDGKKLECNMTLNPSYGEDKYIIAYQFYLDII